jgi:hypothetical protein
MREHAGEAVRQAFWRFLPKSVNVSKSEGQDDALEVGICDLNELRQVRLLAIAFCQ